MLDSGDSKELAKYFGCQKHTRRGYLGERKDN